MLRCLCQLCMGRSGLKACVVSNSGEQTAGTSYPTASTAASELISPGKVNAGIHAGNVSRTQSSGPVTASGLALGSPAPSTDTVYVPICSPFSTGRSLGARDAEFVSITEKMGSEARTSPESELASSKRTGASLLSPADGSQTNLSPTTYSSTPVSYNQLAATLSPCDQHPPCQIQPPQGSPSADISTSNLSLQPSSLLPGHIFLIHQATSSSQSAGGTTNPSLPMLPANMNCTTVHLSTGASVVRSETCTTEATVRLPGEPAGVPLPAALMASEASTTRLVKYLSHESVDTGVATAAASTTANSSSTARQQGAEGLASAGPAACSPVGAGTTGGAGRKAQYLRAAALPTSGPSSSFSLFGALQAFVEQRHTSEAAPSSAAGIPTAPGSAAHSPAQGGTPGPGDHFHGFDHGAVGRESLDEPTATLSRLRPVGSGMAQPAGCTAGDSSSIRKPKRGGDEGSGAVMQSFLDQVTGGGACNGDRRNGMDWCPAGPRAKMSPGLDANAQEGIIIGGGCMGSIDSSGNAIAMAPVSGLGASSLASGGPSGLAPRISMTGEDVLGIFGYGRPLSGLHSFDGTASLLSGPTQTFFLDDSFKVGGRNSGTGIVWNGSDTDGSRTENPILQANGGVGGGTRSGGVSRGGAAAGNGDWGGQPLHMLRRAERREFLSAAKSINSVLQDVQILSVLGAGAHGKVYKGALKDRFVAVKVIIHDTDVPSVIPASSLTGMRHVPSNTSLADAASGAFTSGQMLAAPASEADPTTPGNSSAARAPSGRGLSPFARAAFDVPHGSGSDVLMSGGPSGGAIINLGGGRRGTSGAGIRPAVHPLRYQRSGSSSLYALPLTLPGGGESGPQGAVVPTLPVLSLPGMPPVVMPHKHMLEGLISASAQHPNIVETYRIVTQLLSAPSMPAFVVTRGSQSPLWETTNLTTAAVLRLANGSTGGSLKKFVSDAPASVTGIRSKASASSGGMTTGSAQGAPQGQPHGVGGTKPLSEGVARVTLDRLQRASIVPRSPFSALSSPSPRLQVSAAELNGSNAAEPTAWDLPKVNPGPVSSNMPEGSRSTGNGAAGQPLVSCGCSAASGGGGSGGRVVQILHPDKVLVTIREASPPGEAEAQDVPTAQRDSLMSSDGTGAALSFAGAAGTVDVGQCSSGGGPLRENSTMCVSTLVGSVGSVGRVFGPEALLARGEDSQLPAGALLNGSFGPRHTSSSSSNTLGQASGMPAAATRTDRSSLELGPRSGLLSSGVAMVSASGLAECGPEVDASRFMATGQSARGGRGLCEEPDVDLEGVADLGAEVEGRLARLPSPAGPQLESGEGRPSPPEGKRPGQVDVIVPVVVHRQGDVGLGPGSVEVAGGGQDPDSAELILDMLGAQAAAQRTASFMRRRQHKEQQQQPQQMVPDGCSSSAAQGAQGSQTGRPAEPSGLHPGLPESPPWCLPLDGDPDEDIVGMLRHTAAATRSVGGLGSELAASNKVSGAMSDGGSGSVPLSTRPGGLDSPLVELPASSYEYMVADDSGQLLPHVENFGLSTALFSTFRNSYAPTEYASVSGRPRYRPLQYLRGSQSSMGGSSVPGDPRPQAGLGGGGGGGGGEILGGALGTAGQGQTYGASTPAKTPGVCLHVESAGSLGSSHVMEASLSLPPPLQTSALPGQHSASAIGSGIAPSAFWLPTIDELTAGVSVDPMKQSLPVSALMAGRSSAGSTARNFLQHTGSLGSGEQGTVGGGSGGTTRTSNGSGATVFSGTGTGTQKRSQVTSTPNSNYGGQLMPAELNYDKLSWSNQTHTSASTSANAMLNSGFTTLLSSNNTMMTGGGSVLGGGGQNWRRGDNMGVGGPAGPRRTANTAGGAETHGDTTANLIGSAASANGTDTVRGLRPGSGPRPQNPSNYGDGCEGELRPLVAEPQSQSFTEPRSARGAVGPRQRAVAAARAAGVSAQVARGRERWQVLIVQELCTRGNLRDAITGGTFHSANASAGTQVIAMRQLLDTAAEIASAMAYLHSRAIVHGDLKTANVLLQRQESDPRGFVAKLADFGLARQLGPHGAEDGLLVSRIGTVTHMAPETIRDNMVLLGSDVYSFGVILWELYCAQLPFANYSAFQLLSAVVQYDERPQFPVHCPPTYAALAVRCMAKNPRERPTFAEVHKELITIRDELFGSGGSGSGQGLESMGTLKVPLEQARKEATRVLQSHLQALSGPNMSMGSRQGSSTLRGDVVQNSDATSGTNRDVGPPDSPVPHSSESWDVCSRPERQRD